MEFEHDVPIEGRRPGPSRRAVLLKAAFGVGAVTIGSQVVSIGDLVAPAGAATAPEAVDDATLAGFNQGLMLAAAGLYRRVIDAKVITEAQQLTLLNKFMGHHNEWAGVLRGTAADKAPNRPNSVLSQTAAGQIDSTTSAAGQLHVLFDVENAVASTLASALSSMQSAANRTQIAPLLPVIGQHAAMLGLATGRPLTDKQMLPAFQSKDGALDMTKYTEN